jgi:sec1 family domain-containing protein 1
MSCKSWMTDKFWVENSWSPFPKVAEEIEAQLAKYKQDVDEVNQRTGGAAGESPIDRRRADRRTEQGKNIMNK